MPYVYIPGIGPCVEQGPLVGVTRQEQITEIRQRHAEMVEAATEYLLSETELDVWEIVELGIGEGIRRPRKIWYHPDAGGVYPEYPDAKLYLFCEVPTHDGEG